MNIFFSEPKNFELQELYSNTYQHYIDLTSKCYFKNIHPIFDKILFNTLLTTECYIIKNSLENNKIKVILHFTNINDLLNFINMIKSYFIIESIISLKTI